MPRTARTQQQRVAESTTRLIEAAIDLLCEQSWAETTAAQIADRAGYSREMVRVRFGSKEGLIRHILADWEGGLLGPRADEGRSGIEVVAERITALERLLTERPRFARAVISYSFQSVGDREHHERLQAWLSRLVTDSEALIRLGQADGSITSDIDPANAAREMTDRAVGLVLRWLVNPDAPVEEDLRAWRSRILAEWSASGGRTVAPAADQDQDQDRIMIER